MIPQIEQIVDYIADSFTNYELIVAESANKKTCQYKS